MPNLTRHRLPSTVQLLDTPAAVLVTPEVLAEARRKTDVVIPDYNSFSVDFTPEQPGCAPEKSTLTRPEKICDSALELVGRTPMVRLSRFAKKYGLKCDLVAKCEFLSVGGSVKDRIGLRMIEEAEAQGRLKPNDCIVEATSGNTGIGLCLAGAVKGYRMLITLPEKMSQEKLNAMAALGAEIIRTPTEAAWDSLESHIGLASQLQQTLPKCHFLNQYVNSANPGVHYATTAEEILYQCDNKVDMIVMTTGTGGTLSGTAAKLKERLSSCVVVGVDPRGSILAQPEELNERGKGQAYLVEGIGYDFIPPTLSRKFVDEWVKTDDNESFRLARELIRLEGLLIGGSSGAALAGVLKAAQDLGPNDRCVVILPDSARNYMTKFISDDWMVGNGFYEPRKALPAPGSEKRLKDLGLFRPAVTVQSGMTCGEAVKIMKSQDVEHLVVLSAGQRPLGVCPLSGISAAVVSANGSLEDGVTRHVASNFKLVTNDWKISDVGRVLGLYSFVIVMGGDNKVEALLTPTDLFKALTNEAA